MATTARGHGQYGLRSNLRTFSELDSISAVARHTYCELYAGQFIGGPGSWTTLSGAWFLPYNEVFDGRPQDTVGIITASGMLTRVETLAACQATAGTFFWDNDTATYAISGIDDEAFGIDLELGVDDGAELYIHLAGDADPNGIEVLALTIFGFWTGTKENPALAVQPILSGNLFTDGGFEDWASASVLNQWATQLTVKGAGTLSQADPLIDDGGAFSVQINGTSTNGTIGVRQALYAPIAGESYRIAGAYMTQAPALPSGATVHLTMPQAGASPLREDGRTLAAGDGAVLAETHGETRRFAFDVIWPTGGTGQQFILVNTSGSECFVRFDDVSIQRIYGWRWFESRLTAEVPQFSQGATDVYPGTEEGGGGQVVILNDATEAVAGITGYCEGMLSLYDFTNTRCVIRHGGQFLDDGQDILWGDMALGFAGLIRQTGCNDDAARFDVEEYLALFRTEVPLRKYNRLDTPNVNAAALDRHRPYQFGFLENVSPERIDTVTDTGIGVYELLDPAIAPNVSDPVFTNGTDIHNVWSYEDMDGAANLDSARRIRLVQATDFDFTNPYRALAQFKMLKNPRPIRIEEGVNDTIDFIANGTTYHTNVAPGLKFLRQIAQDLTDVCNAATGGTPFAWAFTEASGGLPHHKFSVVYSGAGTLSLLLDTGAHRDISIFPTIGFANDADLTGLTTYTADTSIPYDPDTTAIVRVDGFGYRDDASGTYTGTPSSEIRLGPDVMRVLLVKVLRVDPATQIGATFTSSRTACPQWQAVYLGGLTSVQGGASFSLYMADVAARLGNGTKAGIISDASGVFHYVPRTGDVPENAPHFRDVDFLEWWGELRPENVYGTVRDNFGQDPTTGLVQGRESTLPRPILQGRTGQRTFDTFNRFEYDASIALAFKAALAAQPIRHFAFRTVGRGAALRVGDIVLLTRARSIQAPGETGGLDGDPFRVLRVDKNPIDGTVSYVVHTNVVGS